jgi:hypothetical protein
MKCKECGQELAPQIKFAQETMAEIKAVNAEMVANDASGEDIAYNKNEIKRLEKKLAFNQNGFCDAVCKKDYQEA